MSEDFECQATDSATGDGSSASPLQSGPGAEVASIVDVHGRRIEALIAEMTGPRQTGSAVIIEGHAIPNMVMHDRGEMVEFVLDDRFSFAFPRHWAYLAANFASTSMAIGAGHPHFKHPHKSHQAYATRCVELDLTDGDIT